MNKRYLTSVDGAQSGMIYLRYLRFLLFKSYLLRVLHWPWDAVSDISSMSVSSSEQKGTKEPSRGRGARRAQSSFGFPLPPLKFRTAGFPQYGFKWTVNGDLRRRPRFKCRPHTPRDSVLYATAVATPRNT